MSLLLLFLFLFFLSDFLLTVIWPFSFFSSFFPMRIVLIYIRSLLIVDWYYLFVRSILFAPVPLSLQHRPLLTSPCLKPSWVSVSIQSVSMFMANVSIQSVSMFIANVSIKSVSMFMANVELRFDTQEVRNRQAALSQDKAETVCTIFGITFLSLSNRQVFLLYENGDVAFLCACFNLAKNTSRAFFVVCFVFNREVTFLYTCF